tara:strand:+ start:483 stop:644 length:162 start_codon:yes stop_codon:yes gene_type:complete
LANKLSALDFKIAVIEDEASKNNAEENTMRLSKASNVSLPNRGLNLRIKNPAT